MKVLIIQQKMIGDVLTSSILFEIIKTQHPNYELHYLINSHTKAVVENNLFIDKFIYFTPETKNSKSLFWRFLKTIRKEKYDVVVDVYGKWSSNFITAFSGAKTSISYYKWYTQGFYKFTVKRKKEQLTHAGLAIENRLQLLEPLRIKIAETFKPKLFLLDNEIENARNYLVQNSIDLYKPLFMISILGSGENKTYPLPYMAQVIDFIAQQTKGQLVFNYMPTQETEAQIVYNLCKQETQKQIFFNVFGKNLREFIAITKHCKCLIGNEGGSTNMAKAIDIPTFSIYSPWNFKEHWSMFESETNVSVHLKDFSQNLYLRKTTKDLKKNVLSLYAVFKPDLFFDQLKTFLTKIT
jgi:heptosyltransferase-2